MKAHERLQASLTLLINEGYKVPAIIHIQIEDMYKAYGGTIQIWKCKKCPKWEYRSQIQALSVDCPKGHPAKIVWTLAGSTLARYYQDRLNPS